MAIKINYNGVDFPSTIRPMSVGFGVDLAEVELPRRDGAATQAGRAKGRTLQAKGVLQDDDPVALQATYDAFKATCFGGARVAQALYFGADDRYILAQLQEWSDDYALGEQSGVCYRINVSVAFFAGDPFWYATSAATATLGTSGATLLTVGGVAPAAPVWTVTIGAAGTGTVTIGNAATSETAILAGTFAAGDVITLDWANYTAAVNGAAQFGILSGQIPGLAVGENSVTVGAVGAALSGASVGYTARYL